MERAGRRSSFLAFSASHGRVNGAQQAVSMSISGCSAIDAEPPQAFPTKITIINVLLMLVARRALKLKWIGQALATCMVQLVEAK